MRRKSKSPAHSSATDMSGYMLHAGALETTPPLMDMGIKVYNHGMRDAQPANEMPPRCNLGVHAFSRQHAAGMNRPPIAGIEAIALLIPPHPRGEADGSFPRQILVDGITSVVSFEVSLRHLHSAHMSCDSLGVVVETFGIPGLRSLIPRFLYQ